MGSVLEDEIAKLESYGSMRLSLAQIRRLHRLKAKLALKLRDAKAARQKMSASSERRYSSETQATNTAAQEAAARRMEEEHRRSLTRTTGDITAARDQARSDIDPWYKAGTDALGKLQTKIDVGPGDFKKSPGYQFRLDEGQKAISRSAAARGGALSGAAVKESLRYGQNFATADYDNFLRRYYDSLTPLQQLSGQGMGAAQQKGGYSTQAARDIASSRFASTSAITNAMRYGADASAEERRRFEDFRRQQDRETALRNYSYAAWKGGEEF